MVTARQLEIAVLTAMGSVENTSSENRRQASKFCDDVKASESGWISGVELFTSSDRPEARFFALSIFQDALGSRPGALCQLIDPQSRLRIRECMMTWLRCSDIDLAKHEKYFLTKVAVVLALLVKCDFPELWPSAFTELFDLLPLGHAQVDLFFRFLSAIDDEIVKFNTQRVRIEAERNAMVKDAIRSYAISGKICSVVRDTSVLYRKELPSLSAFSLEVFSKMIPWFDIGLTVNDNMLPVLFEFVKQIQTMPDISEAAISCLEALILKGMGINDKLQLLISIGIVDLLRIVPIPIDHNDNAAMRLAELASSLVTELLSMWEDVDKSTHEGGETALLLSSSIPLLWPYAEHPNIEVAECTEDAINALVQCMKHEKGWKAQPIPQDLFSCFPTFKAFDHAPKLLEVVYARMQFPIDYEFDEQDDYDGEQETFRSTLRKIFVNICRVSPTMVLEFIYNVLTAVSVPLNSLPWPAAEAMLRILYHFSEGCTGTSSMHNAHELLQEGAFPQIISALHYSDIAIHPHPHVVMLYLDLTVRYSNVLKKEKSLLPRVLESYCGSSGLSHVDCLVRAKASSCLSRLVKLLGQDLEPYVDAMVPMIADLLISSTLNELFTNDSILSMYQTLGCVIGLPGISPDVRVSYLERVMLPLLLSIREGVANCDMSSQDSLDIGNKLAFRLAGLANISKGLTKRMPEVLNPFGQELEAATALLLILPTHSEVRAKVIFLIHRMVPVLLEDLLPMVGRAVETLVANCSGSDLEEVVQLLNQFCKVFGPKASDLLNLVVFPLIRKIHEIMPRRALVDNSNIYFSDISNKNGNLLSHEIVERTMKLKLYLGFLNHVISNGMFGILCNDANIQHLDSVLESILDALRREDDPLVFKSCISVLLAIFDVVVVDFSETSSGPSNVSTGVMKFIIDNATPFAFRRIFEPAMNLKDANSISAVNQMGNLLYKINQIPGKYEAVVEVILRQHQQYFPDNMCDLLALLPGAVDSASIGKEIRQFAAEAKKSKRATSNR